MSIHMFRVFGYGCISRCRIFWQLLSNWSVITGVLWTLRCVGLWFRCTRCRFCKNVHSGLGFSTSFLGFWMSFVQNVHHVHWFLSKICRVQDVQRVLSVLDLYLWIRSARGYTHVYGGVQNVHNVQKLRLQIIFPAHPRGRAVKGFCTIHQKSCANPPATRLPFTTYCAIIPEYKTAAQRPITYERARPPPDPHPGPSSRLIRSPLRTIIRMLHTRGGPRGYVRPSRKSIDGRIRGTGRDIRRIRNDERVCMTNHRLSSSGRLDFLGQGVLASWPHLLHEIITMILGIYYFLRMMRKRPETGPKSTEIANGMIMANNRLAFCVQNDQKSAEQNFRSLNSFPRIKAEKKRSRSSFPSYRVKTRPLPMLTRLGIVCDSSAVEYEPSCLSSIVHEIYKPDFWHCHVIPKLIANLVWNSKRLDDWKIKYFALLVMKLDHHRHWFDFKNKMVLPHRAALAREVEVLDSLKIRGRRPICVSRVHRSEHEHTGYNRFHRSSSLRSLRFPRFLRLWTLNFGEVPHAVDFNEITPSVEPAKMPSRLSPVIADGLGFVDDLTNGRHRRILWPQHFFEQIVPMGRGPPWIVSADHTNRCVKVKRLASPKGNDMSNRRARGDRHVIRCVHFIPFLVTDGTGILQPSIIQYNRAIAYV